ncbi:MAG TPA: hypothetical protein VIR60_02610, partial [Gammaproteobacteria bacterium]
WFAYSSAPLAQSTPPLAAMTTTPASNAAPVSSDSVPAPTDMRKDNAAEYSVTVDADAEWDRNWLTGVNTAVSAAALEENAHEQPATSDSNITSPAPKPSPKAKTPDKPAPKPTGSASTALAATSSGSMHKTPRAADPHTVATQQYTTAVTALRGGDQPAAETALRAALDAQPAHTAATQALVALLLQQGRGGEADTVLAEALALNPRQPALIILHARLLADRGHDREAVALLQPLDDADAQALLGALQQRLGDDAAATAAYRRALANAPRSGSMTGSNQGAWWLGLAISLERSRQPQAALEAYRRALADARLDAQVNDYVRSRIAALGSGQG